MVGVLSMGHAHASDALESDAAGDFGVAAVATHDALVYGLPDGLLAQLRPATRAGALWRLPACYETEFAPDIEHVATTTGIAANTANQHVQYRRTRQHTITT